jgi:hypothetical protein
MMVADCQCAWHAILKLEDIWMLQQLFDKANDKTATMTATSHVTTELCRNLSSAATSLCVGHMLITLHGAL